MRCLQARGLVFWGDMQFFLVAVNAFINKKPSITNPSNFTYPCQVYTFADNNHRLNPAFKSNTFYQCPT